MAEGSASFGFERSDYGNARYLQNLCNGTLKYDYRYGSWFFWQDGRWRQDTEGYARMRAVQATVSRATNAYTMEQEERQAELRHIVRSQSAGSIEGMLSLARALPDMKAPEWDSDPMMIGVGNGVVDLTTGKFRRQVQADAVLQKSATEFQEHATCPRWDRFISEVVPPEYASYVQRAVGYSLTGQTSEQCFFYLIGEGSNGKSTFQMVLDHLLGEYHAAASVSTFLKRRDHQSTNDLAMLVGKRLVAASESSSTDVWDEVRLKSITGGDPITCRFLYKENFTYKPQFKIWIAANNLIRSTDYSVAFWRRVKLIPFPNTFVPGGEPGLWSTLRRELPGILNWAIQGCLMWQKDGLKAPDTMVKQVQEYKETQVEEAWGGVSLFVKEKTATEDGVRTPVMTLYRAYKAWALESGYVERDLLNTITFGRQLTSLGVKKVRTQDGMNYELKVVEKPSRVSTEAPSAS